MNLVILAVLSLILALGWYSWSMSQIRLMQTWSIGSGLFALSPNGKFLATPYVPYQKAKIGIEPIKAEAIVKLYSFPDEELVRTLKAFPVTQLVFSPDSSLMAAGTGLGEIFIWRTDDGQLLYSLRASIIKPGRENVHSLIFSRDGQTLVSGVGGQIDVWRVADGQLRYSLSHEYNCYGDISPDGQTLALSSGGGYRITLYRLSDGTRLRELESYGEPKFSPDGQLLAIYHSTGYEKKSWQKVTLHRLEDDTFLGALPGLEKRPIALAFSPDGRYLAATYRTGGPRGSFFVFPDLTAFMAPPVRCHLALWRLASLPSDYSAPQVIQSQKKAFTALAFSPDGKILVSGGDAIRLWRMPPQHP